MTDAIMQEHERTVSDARQAMSFHDGRTAMQRWFDNYKENKGDYWGSGWFVVTRDGRRWKIEFGYRDEPASRTVYADPKAPAPPIFEFRPPKPEPVKPRFNVPEPRRVDAWDRGGLTHGALMEMMKAVNIDPRELRATMPPRDWFYERYCYMDRPSFDRYTAPPPPPPTRRNQ